MYGFLLIEKKKVRLELKMQLRNERCTIVFVGMLKRAHSFIVHDPQLNSFSIFNCLVLENQDG